MNDSKMQNYDGSNLRMIHRCSSCARQFRVVIGGDRNKRQKAKCPYCGSVNFFYAPRASFPATGTRDRVTPPEPPKPWSPSRSVGARDYVKPRTTEPKSSFPQYNQPTVGLDFRNSPTVKKDLTRPRKDASGFDLGGFVSIVTYPFRALLGLLGDIGDLFSEFSGARIAILGAALFVGGLLAAVLFFNLYMFFASFGMGHYLTRLEPVRPNRILDRNGDLISELFSRKTGNLKPENIPESLKKKLIFVEDSSFYSHGGIHWPSIARAMVANVLSMDYSQGASTITQQLARILLERREKTIFRKLTEASLAYYLESRLTKDQILAGYMNHVYLGHGAYGMQNAARFYFDKSLDELDFVEQLILVSLPSAPNRYSPLQNPGLLKNKMEAIFDRMVDDGFTDISKEDFEKRVGHVFVSLNRSPNSSVFGMRIDNAPWVTEHIRLKIKDLFGKDYEFGAGLVVHTTLDGRLQKTVHTQTPEYIHQVENKYRAVKILNGKIIYDTSDAGKIQKEYADRSFPGILFGLPQAHIERHRLQAAAVGLDPSTGEVLFMQGGTEFHSRNQLNRVIQMRRQTGSAIKPVIYSAGIESGAITAATILDDTPLFASLDPNVSGGKKYWLPDNITGVYEGEISAREALMRSKNIPAIRVAQSVGISRLAVQFRKFFFSDNKEFDSRFREDYSISIGSLEMSPMEMAVAFSAFGNNGVIMRPYLIRSIVDENGKEIYNGQNKDEFSLKIPPQHRAIPGDTAHVMSTMLEDASKYGGISRGGFTGDPVMGKTGTSNDYKDAWFVGLVPGLSAAVWVGYDNNAYSMHYATGSSVAGPLWGRIVSRGMKVKGNFRFQPTAEKVKICKDTGKLARPECPHKVDEYFTHDHVPLEMCSKHNPNGSIKMKSDDWSLNSDSDFQ